jgi:hypothetical protein
MAYPFKWVPISDELKAFRKPLFEERSSQQGGVVSEPMGIYMPDKMARDCELIYNFKLRPDDVWIVTYPKCGTTWAAVSTILFNNAIFEGDIEGDFDCDF